MMFSGSKGLMVLLPALAGLSLFTSESGSRIVRRLAVDCIQVRSLPSWLEVTYRGLVVSHHHDFLHI
jgi:hypothetical protein